MRPPSERTFIVWNWVASIEEEDGANETPTQSPQDYVLVFWPDGGFSVMAECNVGGGTYTVGNYGALNLVFAPMTRAACGPDSQAREYLDALAGGRSLGFDADDRLIMTLADGGALVFAEQDMAAAVDAGLADRTLRWPGSIDAAGRQAAVDDPMLFALLLRPNGLYTAWAECNVVWGAYSYSALGALTLLPGPDAGATCAVGSQSGAFLEFLSAVRAVAVADDGAVTMTTRDGRSSTFLDLGPVEGPGIHGRTADDFPPQRLYNTIWQWVRDEDDPGVETAVEYYLVLLDEDTFAFVSDCNRGAFGYQVGRTAILFDTLAMAYHPFDDCGNGSLSDTFIGNLALVRSYTFEGNNLALTLADGGVMTLADGGPFLSADGLDDRLVGESWRWVAFNDVGQEVALPDTTDFAISFNDNGAASVVADCVLARAGYASRPDGTLTMITNQGSGLTCSTGPLVDTFFAALNRANAYTIDADGRLRLDLSDGGAMTFAPSP